LESSLTTQDVISEVKYHVDRVDTKIIKSSEMMWEFYLKDGERSLTDLWTEPLLNAHMFSRWVATHINMYDRVKSFTVRFTEYEVKMLHTIGNCVIVGPPGCGKTFLLNAFSRSIEEEYGMSLAAVPYHKLKSVFRGSFDRVDTYQSLFGVGITAEKSKYDPVEYLDRLNMPFVKFKPRENKVKLLAFDEFQSFSVAIEEVAKLLCDHADRLIIAGDPCQQSNISRCGTSLTGSIASIYTSGFRIEKDIEFRNPCPLYLNARSKTRRGDLTYYTHSSMCDYVTSEDRLNDIVIQIADQVVSSGCADTTIACQGWDIAGSVITNIVRVMMKRLKPEFVLTHIGRMSTTEEDDEAAVENQLKRVYCSKPEGAHTQGVNGIPIVLFPGMVYVVKKTFQMHSDHMRTQEDVGTKLEQTTSVVYDRSELLNVVYDKRITSLRHFIFKSYDMTTHTSGSQEYVLTVFEAASYLQYPFVVLRLSMIGLTLPHVVVLNVSSGYVRRKDDVETRHYARAYTPLKIMLDKAQETYGDCSQYTSIARQMQVALTRVSVGGKTCVIELDRDTYYTRLTSKIMSGLDCDAYCCLYSASDRKNPTYTKEQYNIIAKAIRYRPKKCIVSARESDNPHDGLYGLAFPPHRLVYDSDKDDYLQSWYYCVRSTKRVCK
jgi:GTPase SAR1 family protein